MLCGSQPILTMKLTAPLVFEPLYMERVWGGRKLETLFGKSLPSGAVIGEAWELVDREEAQSVVHCGTLRGKTLNELWTEYREQVFGSRYANAAGRFPLLVKLLDAAEKLSVQVHPPAAVAPELKGEPKTEMWYVASAEEGADMFAGHNGIEDADSVAGTLVSKTAEPCYFTNSNSTGAGINPASAARLRKSSIALRPLSP